MKTNNPLTRARQAFRKAVVNANVQSRVTATIGWQTSETNVIVDVPGLPNYLYITIPEIGVTKALNRANVPRQRFLRVFVVLENNTYVIVSRDNSNLGTLMHVPDNEYGTPAHPLSVHTDVTLTTPAAGNVLAHDGTAWVNEAPVATSAGAGDAGKLVRLDAGGQIDDTMLPAGLDPVEDQILAASTDDTIADADVWGYVTGTALVKTAWSNIKSVLNTYFATVFAPIAKGVTNGDTHDHSGGDGGTLNSDNITEGSTNLFFTTAEETKLAGIEAGADVTDAGNVGSAVNAATTDDTVADTDVFPYATGSTLKKTAWSVIRDTLKTYFDSLYAPVDLSAYALLAGRSGGQTLIGGTASGNNLTLRSTSHATRGKVIFGNAGTTAFDDVNNRFGIGTASPLEELQVVGDILTSNGGFYKSFLVDGTTQIRIFGIGGDNIAYFGGIDAALTEMRVRVSGANNLVVLPTAFGVGLMGATARLHVLQATLGDEVQRLESTATNDDPRESVYQARVATTDATVTTLYTHTIPASTTVLIEARVIARRTGGSSGTAEDGAAYIRISAVKNVAGVATIIGGTGGVPLTLEDQAGWDCAIDVTGATARVRVTGAASNNVTWHGTIRVYPVSS